MSNAPRPATWKMPLTQLRRAGAGVGAADVGVALLLVGRASVPHSGQCVGMTNSRSVPSRSVDDGPDDLGDDVAGLAQHDGVADEHALALHLAARCAASPCRRSSRTRARAPSRRTASPGRCGPTLTWMSRSFVLTSSGGYLKAIAQRGARLVAPSRRCSVDLVDLDDDAVDLVDLVVPVLAGRSRRSRRPRRWSRPRGTSPARGRPHAAQQVVRLRLARRRRSPRRAPMPCTSSRSGRVARDPRVLLPQRPRGRVARVGERRLARLDERGVEVGERLDREEHLAPDLDAARARPSPASTCGTPSIVRTFRVTSSPVRPSPRVAARTSRPRSYSRLIASPSILSSQRNVHRVRLVPAGVTLGPLGPGAQLRRR